VEAAVHRGRTVTHTQIDHAVDRATRFAAAEAAETFDLSRPSRTFASEDDLRRALREQVGLSQGAAAKAAAAAYPALNGQADFHEAINAKLDELLARSP
jgi:hypothetical protein